MEKLSARGYNDAELSRADSSINYEDRQHFIKEKLKSTAIPLVFNTKYNRNFAGKYIRQALECHRQEREIENDIPQATHDTKPTVDPRTYVTQRFQHVHRFRDNRGPNTPGPTP